jgi:hypothetical protein
MTSIVRRMPAVVAFSAPVSSAPPPPEMIDPFHH